jgi:hypothetical protein
MRDARACHVRALVAFYGIAVGAILDGKAVDPLPWS